MPVEIPEEGLAGGAARGIFFGTPKRPEGRVVTLDFVAAGENRFEQGQDLEAGIAVKIAAMDKERPGVSAPAGTTGESIGFDEVGIEEKANAGALAVERLGAEVVILIDGPEIEIAAQ